jgi:hypothetical protein
MAGIFPGHRRHRTLAIERGVALPVGQVPRKIIPFLVLQFQIGRHIFAEAFIQEF